MKEGGFYVWEQVGENDDELGKGFHVHSIARLTGSSTKFSLAKMGVRFANIAKDMGLNMTGQNFQVKRLDTEIYFENKSKYINTDEFCKSDQRKRKAWMLNEKWREQVGLKATYKIKEKPLGQSFFFKSMEE